IEGVENTPTDRELFLRWASIGAYTPMMRTHHGSRYGENWSFEGGPNPDKPEEPLSDPETLATWKRLAAEHISLFPYQQAYGQVAVDRGLPIMRHPLLVFPEDPVFAGELPDEAAWDAFDAVSLPDGETFQYFLGDELLVAPIVDEGVDTRPVHLPAGGWVDIRSGERFEGPGTVMAEAEPGDIPVYAPDGAVIPRLPEGVETLAPTDAPDVVDHTDVADQLVIDVVSGADGSFTLVDGTELAVDSGRDRALEGPVTATVDGDELDTSADGGFVTVLTPRTGDVEIVLSDDDGDETVVEVSGAPLERAYTVRLLG
ncbi:MAG: TIM-barrel domain-containing protein, partial [Actinomycetota bacterium]